MTQPVSTSASNRPPARFRAPSEHGRALQSPPLSEAERVWNKNLQLRVESDKAGELPVAGSSPLAAVGCSFKSLRQLGRQELLEQAQQYLASYLDAASQSLTESRVAALSGEQSDGQSLPPIVMAGHQPELFHAGVWYKNFALSNLGKRCQAIAVNLVVDNDICGEAAIRAPKFVETGDGGKRKAILATIPILPAGVNAPYESRRIADWDFFKRFPERVALANGEDAEQEPILLDQLWPEVITAVRQMAAAGAVDPAQVSVGRALAAGRHRLELAVGLNTLEVPISRLAGTRAFALFLLAIVKELPRFHEIYNQSLISYRRSHRIRSTSHPVPELEQAGQWLELPFWVWQSNTSQPETRRRLFAQVRSAAILLSDLDGWEATLPLPAATATNPSAAKMDATDVFVSAYQQLSSGAGTQGELPSAVAIRPRALMTTMFSRLILSDLFLHGIGGAKYDELTDVIARQFFHIELPDYLTLSATMKLPTDEPIVTRREIAAWKQSLRELRFHPESQLPESTKSDPQVIELVRQKRDWIHGAGKGQRSKAKHQAIAKINASLQSWLIEPRETLQRKIVESASRLRESEILDSREYSWCLFPPRLIDELTRLAKIA